MEVYDDFYIAAMLFVPFIPKYEENNSHKLHFLAFYRTRTHTVSGAAAILGRLTKIDATFFCFDIFQKSFLISVSDPIADLRKNGAQNPRILPSITHS